MALQQFRVTGEVYLVELSGLAFLGAALSVGFCRSMAGSINRLIII